MDDEDTSEFRDVPDEVETSATPTGAMTDIQAANAIPARNRVFPTQKTIELPTPEQEEEFTEETAETEEDYTDVLTDARLRLEQGRLYELVMNNDIFSGSDCDPKAIKNVEKEIRNFAKERMEIMLGMKQEQPKEVLFPSFPFNALEVETLKALASAATKGATAVSEPFTSGASAPAPRKTSLNTIAIKNSSTKTVPVKQPVKKAESKPLPTKPATPVKRTKPSDAVQRILDEEGLTLDQINEVFDPNQQYLTPEQMAMLTPEQIIERNNQSARRLGKTVPSRNAVPMPTQEHIESIYTSRANAAAANPQMQMIMNAINQKTKT